jgi:1-deoxy-D-xylulose-5-phosphate reductoisomerase
MPDIQNIALLGGSGSIGDSTLSIIDQHPHLILQSIVAQKNWQKVLQICQHHRPQYAALADPAANNQLRQALTQKNIPTICPDYEEAIILATQAPEVDTVVAAITGAAGLPGVFSAANAGKRLALANKEALVMAGETVKKLCAQSGAKILPVDSEHNAIYQCLPNHLPQTPVSQIKKIWLTASGGPFRDLPLADFKDITPAQAIAHPNWEMGKKISIDSATMMNKGLELIEAQHIFDIAPQAIDAVIHPQSYVHSFVEYIDGSFLAQLGPPDMRIPIAYAFSWPERLTTGTQKLTPMDFGKLEFAPICNQRFPCFELAKQAMQTGGWAPLVLNAANEIAVDAFLQNQISFPEISAVVEKTLAKSAAFGFQTTDIQDIDAIMHMDTIVRNWTSARLSK